MKKHSISMFQVPPLMVFEYEGDMNKVLEYISNIEYMEGGFSRSKNDYILNDDNLKELRQWQPLATSPATRYIPKELAFLEII